MAEQGSDRRGLAQLHHEVGMAFASMEGAEEQALSHLKSAFEMDPSLTDALAMVADMYLKTKDYEKALPLLQGMLRSVRDPAERARRLEMIGRIQLENLRDIEAAEANLQEASGLAPDDLTILTLLTEVYLDRRYPKEGEPNRKVAYTFLQIARIHRGAQENDKAITALKQAVAQDPQLKEAFSLLASIHEAAGNWSELAELFSGAMSRSEGATRVRLGMRLAEVYEQNLNNADEALKIYEMLSAENPEAVRPRLMALLERREDWDSMARLLEREVAANPPEKTSEARLQLVRLYKDHLGRADRAARHLHDLLSSDPENLEVLDLYIQHFREKCDWRSQVETMETALRVAHSQGVDPSYVIELLKEMATIYRSKLGDLARTERVMKFLVRLQPDNPKMQASFEKIAQQREIWDGYKAEMQQEIAMSGDEYSRLELMRTFASTLLERKLDVDLCIELHQEIIKLAPGDSEAYDALEQLLTQEGNVENLFQLLEARLTEATVEQQEEILRRMFDMARDKLKDPSKIGRVSAKILEIVPDDPEALAALMESLENLENWPKLTALLERWSTRIVDPEEQAPLLLKASEVYDKRLSKPEDALRCLRQVLNNRLELDHVIPKMLDLYERTGNYLEYANLLEMGLREGEWPSEPDQVAPSWKRLAQVWERQVGEPQRALDAWRQLWEQAPEETEYLTHVTRLSYTLEQWDLLVEVMESQIERTTDADKLNNLALRLSEIYDQKLDRPHDALAMLEKVEPTRRDRNVQERLARLYLSTGDCEGAIDLYRGFLEKADTLEEKVQFSLQIAEIYLEQLHDDAKAADQLDHVLALEPSNARALMLQLDLCEKEGRWERLAELTTQLYSVEPDVDKKFVHARKLGELNDVQLENPEEAFAWFKIALQIRPTETEILAVLERLAGENQYWTQLVGVYELLLKEEWSADRDILQKTVDCLRTHLGDYSRAMDWVTRYLMRNQTDEEFLYEAEDLSSKFPEGPNQLASLYEHLINNLSRGPRKFELLTKLARLYEEQLEDPSAALIRWERAFREDPVAPKVLDEIERLARSTKTWDLLTVVQGIRLAQIVDPVEKVDFICKCAVTAETDILDPLRAYRAYLRAFLLEPKNTKVQEELWRLAKLLGTYSADQRVARPVDPDSMMTAGLRELKRRRDKGELAPAGRRGEHTQELEELDLEELEVIDEEEVSQHRFVLSSPTNSLAISDLIEVRTGSLQGMTYDQVVSEFHSDIALQDPSGPQPGMSAEVAPPESAWEEFARAWAMLPYASVEEHVEHLSQMARVWKDGALNNRKAFEILGRAVSVNPLDLELREWFLFEGRALSVLGACCALLERIAGGLVDNAQSISLYREVAELYTEIKQWQKREDVLRAILELDSHDAKAYGDLIALLVQLEQWENQGLLMEWKFGLDDLPLEEKINLLREIAIVYETKLERPEVAHSWWNKVLSMEPDNIEFLLAVLRLSKQLQMWQKAAEVLRKLADISDVEEEQLLKLHELAHITVSELELPDQAIHIYREILEISATDGVAVAALDKLFTTHELWSDLEEILEKQIQNSSGDTRLAFMERLGEVLEKLNRPEEAAFTYEKLWQDSAKPVFARKASAMFMEIGRAADGVDILLGLLNSETADYEPMEKANLWTQLAIIQKRSLSNEAAARVSLDRALGLVPDHMGALQLLAEMSYDHKDWETFVQMEQKIADAATDQADRDAALFLVGRTLRDQVRDPVRARDTFAQLLRKNPHHADALTAQYVLAEELEDWTLALTMLEQRFPLLAQKDDRARNLTRQAEIRLRYFEDINTAYEILGEALTEDPNHVGAILALADLAEHREEWDRAGELLENALKKLKDEPGKMSRLARRYAQLMERTGKIENAVTLLQEMERRYPDELLMKLTLGEIRYQQGRWRETTKLLSALGDHPQAGEFAGDVANALCMAADSELKQRKGGTAPIELWETAVRLKPDHLPAIEALLAFHIERGDQGAAAGYLRAQAEAATNPETRFSLFHSLAELYLNEIKSKVDAYECYYNLWVEITEPGPGHITILKNLVTLAEDLHREHEVLSVYKALLNLVEEGEKLMMLVKAGEVALHMGEIAYAQEVLETAQKKAPANEKVLAALSELYENTGQHAAALRILQELAERKVGSASEPARRGSVLKRLGRVHVELGTPIEAIVPILEESLSLIPSDDDVRRLLIQVYGDDPRYTESRSRQYQELLQKNPINGRALRDLTDQAVRNEDQERRFIYTQMLSLLGQCTPEENEWLASLAGRSNRVPIDYANRLEDADKLELEAVAHETPLVTVFETLWEAAPAVFGSDINALGLTPQDRVSPVDKSDVATIYQELARVLGARSTSLYVGNPDTYQGVVVACHAPQVIIVGRDSLDELAVTLRFYLARAMELACPKFIFAAGLYPEDFSRLLAALTRAFHPKYARHQFKTLDPVDERAQELKKVLPYRVSKTIVEFFTENPNLTFDSGAWRKAVWMAGNRAGLLLTGDLPEALRLVLFEETQQVTPATFTEPELAALCVKTPVLQDLFSFFVSPLHVRLRRLLGLALQ
ncbi:tetratricopeptide repeat protein [Myxococcota bacterium]|nr:tetratricopeptide repeat protein [Myxococcota bacterium]